ncbi:ABC transporter ATP-binding protein [Limnochorda pilosa]|uniref:ABC transporter n=1 Tax=Limnochorda pilosa TaxID=1555112 RepID=A0A0K2SLW5_LIMPI|nr:ABC transporter ATP-binding protein [Limnochorda pilosa]BAS28002.1 ABC transporter [Limnochorda pilosa]
MLSLREVHAGYGKGTVLNGISLEVEPGRVVALLGRNGAGKTTTLRAIAGLVRPARGSIWWQGSPIHGLPPHLVARRGIALVPQGRHIFASLSVQENLMVGFRSRPEGERAGLWDAERIYRHFPILRERARVGGTRLSGGEQQMLAIARALMTQPQILLCDEPCEGLAPMMVLQVGEILQALKEEGLAILLVEQNVEMAFSIADRVHVVSGGQVAYEGAPEDLRRDEAAQVRYLGVSVS